MPSDQTTSEHPINSVTCAFIHVLVQKLLYLNYANHQVQRYDNNMFKTGPQRQMDLTVLTGMQVCSPDGEALGDIEEVVVDVCTGTVESIRLRLAQTPRGRVLRISIPWSLLQISDDHDQVELDIALQTLVTVASRRAAGSTH